ncbi:MAG: hypothetical protein ACKOPS_02970, partial [Cyanobium sp.]
MKIPLKCIIRAIDIVALITGLLYTIASLLLYAVPAWKASAFLLLRDMRMPSFADLRWVTANSECGVD